MFRNMSASCAFNLWRIKMYLTGFAANTDFDIADTISQIFSSFFNMLGYGFTWIFENHDSFATVYTGIIHWIMPLLALGILMSVLRRMLRVKNPREIWGYLNSKELGKFPINHWESTIGRASHCDITVKFATISKTQCSIIRDDDGIWTLHNLSEYNITKVNGEEIPVSVKLHHGDIIDLGGVKLRFEAISKQEHEIQIKRRMLLEKPIQPWYTYMLRHTLYNNVGICTVDTSCRSERF